MTKSTALPVLERELRVASRKRSTFWMRAAAALAALVIGACTLSIMLGPLHLAMGGGTPAVGSTLFGILTWMSFVAALASGLFFTADSLSEEKREGTLGLLFLTDLRGYDVAAGKLGAAWLRCFYCLLAIVPMLALTFVMGGVTGEQFYETMLALVNALFCSLAAGLFVSALSRDPQKALGTTSVLLFLLSAGGPMLDSWLSRAGVLKHGESILRLTSPFYVCQMAGMWSAKPFWSGLAVSHFIGWLLLGGTCVLVPHTWQDRGARARPGLHGWSYVWRYGGKGRRRRLRRALLERNPILWLCCRERWQGLVVWALALLVLAQFIFAARVFPPYVMLAWQQIGSLVNLLLYLWLASQACRFFIEARRSGLIELLLATPVDAPMIVRGHWRALLRMFAAPIVIILIAQAAGAVVAQQRMMASAVTPAAPARARTRAKTRSSAAGTNSTTFAYSATANSNRGQALAMGAASAAVGAATSAANLFALAIFGLWMGMTSKNNSIATLKTVALVQVVPLMAIWFVSFFCMMGWMSVSAMRGGSGAAVSFVGEWFAVFMLGVVFVLSLGKDIAFSVWARSKLLYSFRETASRADGPGLPAGRASATSTPPPLPPKISSVAPGSSSIPPPLQG